MPNTKQTQTRSKRNIKTKKAPVQPNTRNLSKIFRPVAAVSVILFLVIGILAGGLFLYDMLYKKNAVKLDKLTAEYMHLKSVMHTDVIRQDKLQKMLQIIRNKNPDLSSSEMYDIANEIYEMSIKYSNLDVDLLCAVITHESANTWNPDIKSPAGAMGLMQIMPVTGMFLANYEGLNWTTPEEILYNPVYNIRLGARFLSSLMTKYDLDGALAAYNAGERVAAKWVANGKDEKFLWEETRGYIPAVQNLYKDYMSKNL